jgi:hypothetical protein
MRIQRTMQFLTIVVTFSACNAPADSAANQPDAAPPVAAAPAPAPVVETTPVVALSATWDSGPLDLAYHREHDDMDARHKREVANPSAGESSARRGERQASETKTLELRYKRGKAAHARTLPPAER